MQLLRLWLHGFLSHSNSIFDFSSAEGLHPFLAVVGASRSGKSNVVRAIEAILRMFEMSQMNDSPNVYYDQLNAHYWDPSNSDPTVAEMMFELNDDEKAKFASWRRAGILSFLSNAYPGPVPPLCNYAKINDRGKCIHPHCRFSHPKTCYYNTCKIKECFAWHSNQNVDNERQRLKELCGQTFLTALDSHTADVKHEFWQRLVKCLTTVHDGTQPFHYLTFRCSTSMNDSRTMRCQILLSTDPMPISFIGGIPSLCKGGPSAALVDQEHSAVSIALGMGVLKRGDLGVFGSQLTNDATFWPKDGLTALLHGTNQGIPRTKAYNLREMMRKHCCVKYSLANWPYVADAVRRTADAIRQWHDEFHSTLPRFHDFSRGWSGYLNLSQFAFRLLMTSVCIVPQLESLRPNAPLGRSKSVLTLNNLQHVLVSLLTSTNDEDTERVRKLNEELRLFTNLSIRLKASPFVSTSSKMDSTTNYEACFYKVKDRECFHAFFESASGADMQILLVLTALCAANATTVILDEPERMLPENLRKRLRNLLQKSAPRAAILITTHSGDMLAENVRIYHASRSASKPRSKIIPDYEQTLVTCIHQTPTSTISSFVTKPRSDSGVECPHSASVDDRVVHVTHTADVRLFDVPPTSQNIVFSRGAIFVEGVNDERFLQALNAVLEQNGQSLIWTVFPMGGAGGAPKHLRLAEALNVRHLVLLDGDTLEPKNNLFDFLNGIHTKDIGQQGRTEDNEAIRQALKETVNLRYGIYLWPCRRLEETVLNCERAKKMLENIFYPKKRSATGLVESDHVEERKAEEKTTKKLKNPKGLKKQSVVPPVQRTVGADVNLNSQDVHRPTDTDGSVLGDCQSNYPQKTTDAKAVLASPKKQHLDITSAALRNLLHELYDNLDEKGRDVYQTISTHSGFFLPLPKLPPTPIDDNPTSGNLQSKILDAIKRRDPDQVRKLGKFIDDAGQILQLLAKKRPEECDSLVDEYDWAALKETVVKRCDQLLKVRNGSNGTKSFADVIHDSWATVEWVDMVKLLTILYKDSTELLDFINFLKQADAITKLEN
eukprot:GILK01005557.1.p1 GENE.GILK01005557.1~~GILK01005557.1.p1  ORF type:complete len:1058 (+),score=53.71 GILK01005557.1:94-3267(+)